MGEITQPYGDVGAIEDAYTASLLMPASMARGYIFTSDIVAPYHIIATGSLSDNADTGFLYILANGPDVHDDRIAVHSYENKGAITAVGLANDNDVVLFTYSEDQQGYYAISEDIAYFTPYVK